MGSAKKWIVATLVALFSTAGIAGCFYCGHKFQIPLWQRPCIVLSQDYTFMAREKKYILPAGEYDPIYQDKDGIYFGVPEAIRVKPIFVTELVRGGIYIPNGFRRAFIFTYDQSPYISGINRELLTLDGAGKPLKTYRIPDSLFDYIEVVPNPRYYNPYLLM